jgi:hypothetical protein
MTATPDLLTIVVSSVFGAAIFVGVVLPAVWSAKPERRAAALATLKELSLIVRRAGGQGPRS